MPYIPKVRRPALDPIIDGLIGRLQGLDGLCKGDVNYVITRIVVETLIVRLGYHQVSDAVSVLRDSADEINRRLMGPREECAIEGNGDLECFARHDGPLGMEEETDIVEELAQEVLQRVLMKLGGSRIPWSIVQGDTHAAPLVSDNVEAQIDDALEGRR